MLQVPHIGNFMSEADDIGESLTANTEGIIRWVMRQINKSHSSYIKL